MDNKMRLSSKNDLKYYLALFIMCVIIPHLILFLLDLESVASSLSPFEIETYSNFIVCQWMPFWLVFISYLRLQKLDSLSPSVLLYLLIIYSFLPRWEQRSILIITLTIPLIVSMELTMILNKFEFSNNKILAGIGMNRKMIRAFYFWSLVFLGLINISCYACTWDTAIVSPFQLFPISGILLLDVFRHQKNQPPTIWSIIVMVAAIPLSLYLATIGPMEQFKIYHLMSLGIGYAFLFLMLIVYNVDYWKSRV